MKVYFARAFLFAAVLFASFFLVSCDTLKTLENLGNNEVFNPSSLENTPEYVVSIHRIIRYPRANDLEQEIATFAGNKIVINVNSEAHSRNFLKIEMVPSPKDPQVCDLKITLDRRGKMLWGNLALSYRGEPLAFIVDGIMYRQFNARPLREDDDFIIIDGPFDRNTASNIAKSSEKNYKIFTPNPRT